MTPECVNNFPPYFKIGFEINGLINYNIFSSRMKRSLNAKESDNKAEKRRRKKL
jgi:hypothetical protein